MGTNFRIWLQEFYPDIEKDPYMYNRSMDPTAFDYKVDEWVEYVIKYINDQKLNIVSIDIRNFRFVVSRE